MAVGRDDVMGDPAPDLAPADDGRDVRPLAPDRDERALERRPLGAARGVAQHRLVVGVGNVCEPLIGASRLGEPGK